MHCSMRLSLLKLTPASTAPTNQERIKGEKYIFKRKNTEKLQNNEMVNRLLFLLSVYRGSMGYFSFDSGAAPV